MAGQGYSGDDQSFTDLAVADEFERSTFDRPQPQPQHAAALDLQQVARELQHARRRHLVGAGFDVSTLIKAAEELAKTGVTEGGSALEKKYGNKPPTPSKSDSTKPLSLPSSTSSSFPWKPVAVAGGVGLVLTGLFLLLRKRK